jgi:hypothetical protein
LESDNTCTIRFDKLKEETEDDKKKAETNEKQFKDMLELVKNTIGTQKIEKVELNPNL